VRYFFDFEFHEDGETIEPISMGMVCENGNALYIEFQFDVERAEANEWLAANVLPHLRIEPAQRLTRDEAKAAILEFIGDDEPQFWAYYADYDWVALCQIFGKMVDLPKGWPKFCFDLQQWWILLGQPPKIPKPENAHDALADAEWNVALFQSFADGERHRLCPMCGRRPISGKTWNMLTEQDAKIGKLIAENKELKAKLGK